MPLHRQGRDRFFRTGTRPGVVDGDRTVSESWAIATYLEEAYADRPSLFGGRAGQTTTRFINSWADTVVVAGIARLILTDVYVHLHQKDRCYFRETREKRFGMSLEMVSADRDVRVEAFRQSRFAPYLLLNPFSAVTRRPTRITSSLAAFSGRAARANSRC